MLYSKLLKKKRACPFCHPDQSEVILQNKKAFLTYALAPYTKYHLLVAPKRHVVSFLDLTKAEDEAISKLLEQGVEIFKKLKLTNYSILVRNGDNKQKSVRHLHYHLIPNHRIGDLDSSGRPRKVLTKTAALVLAAKLVALSKKLYTK